MTADNRQALGAEALGKAILLATLVGSGIMAQALLISQFADAIFARYMITRVIESNADRR